MSFYYSNKSNKIVDDIRWVDDVSRENSVDDLDRKHSISSENEGSGSDADGRRALRMKSTNIWDDDMIWLSLQGLHGFDDLVEKIRHEDVEDCLDNQFALTSGVLIASQLCKVGVLRRLLEEGGSVSTTDSSGRTPLHLATNANCLECVKLLIEHGANVNQKDITNKIAPLHCAASRGSLHCIKYLLKSGASVNTRHNKTPLHYAVDSLAIDCVRELLEAGATPSPIQVFSETPLHVAASLGSTEIIKLLIKHGCSVNVQSGHEKWTALHLAAEDGNSEAVRILIDAGADINALNHKNQTPVHTASLCQATECIEFLLKRGADPNASDIDGRTPLHGAIVKVSRNSECVKLLLNYGAKVNQPDNFGYTPLHLAALNEFSNCVSLLINYGGDVTRRTNGGVSVLTFITRRTPDVIPKYVAKFDNSIKLTDHEIGDVDCELKLDFRILVPSNNKGETELLLNFIEVGHRDILKHPLCETFLFLKWRRIRKYFLFSLFYHFVYVLLFTAYVEGVFMLNCGCTPRNRSILMEENCKVAPHVNIISYFLISLNLLMMGKELFQITHNWYNYIKHWENWLQWTIILSVFFCVVPISDDIRKIIHCWQHHVAAIGIFLTWVELMMIVGRFPIFGLYIQMFTTVAVNFVKFLLAYLCLLIAFSLSFNVLFPYHPPFKTLYIGLIKTIIMMSGELEFEDIFYNNIPVKYPGTAQIMFLAFVVLVTIILTNLMLGLAVSDIQGLQQSAGLDRLVRQAELVAHLESMLFSRLLQWVPRRLLAFFYRHALLLKSEHHCALYIKPNDPREERIPKDLIKNIYNLIAEKKERSRKKRRSGRRNVNSDYHLPRINSINDYVYSGKPHGSISNPVYQFSIK